MNGGTASGFDHHGDALAAVRSVLKQFQACSDAEKSALDRVLANLQETATKLEKGRVDIAVFLSDGGPP